MGENVWIKIKQKYIHLKNRIKYNCLQFQSLYLILARNLQLEWWILNLALFSYSQRQWRYFTRVWRLNGYYWVLYTIMYSLCIPDVFTFTNFYIWSSTEKCPKLVNLNRVVKSAFVLEMNVTTIPLMKCQRILDKYRVVGKSSEWDFCGNTRRLFVSWTKKSELDSKLPIYYSNFKIVMPHWTLAVEMALPASTQWKIQKRLLSIESILWVKKLKRRLTVWTMKCK